MQAISQIQFAAKAWAKHYKKILYKQIRARVIGARAYIFGFAYQLVNMVSIILLTADLNLTIENGEERLIELTSLLLISVSFIQKAIL